MMTEIFTNPKHSSMKSYFKKELQGKARKRTFRKGELLDPDFYSDCFKIVAKGIVKMGVVSREGQYRLFHLIRQGEVYDEYPQYPQDDEEVIAKEDSEIWFYPFRDIRKLDHPEECMEFLLYSMHRKYFLLRMQALSKQFDDISGQIASIILRTTYQSGEVREDGKFTLDYGFTHDEMASIIGCSRVTVTRHLQEFKDAKLLEFNNRCIVINDINLLKRFTVVK